MTNDVINAISEALLNLNCGITIEPLSEHRHVIKYNNLYHKMEILIENNNILIWTMTKKLDIHDPLFLDRFLYIIVAFFYMYSVRELPFNSIPSRTGSDFLKHFDDPCDNIDDISSALDGIKCKLQKLKDMEGVVKILRSKVINVNKQ